MSTKLAIAQFNATVGDIPGNANQIIALAQQAQAQGANLMITPELGLCGYPPEDLLFRQDFILSNQKALSHIATSLPDMTLLVGHPHQESGQLYNAASLLQHGKIIATYHKHALPNYSVFDEERYFQPGQNALVFTHENIQFGVLICADGWEPAPAAKAKDAGAEVLLSLNASPYHIDKLLTRHDILRERVAETGLPLVYCNLVGGQDELVFDGGSFVIDAEQNITHQLPSFETALEIVELSTQPAANLRISKSQKIAISKPLSIAPALSKEAAVYQALRLGLTDYVNKNGFPSVVLGLSGGIDSALTLAIAVDALGAQRVKVVLMPSQFTASMSNLDAQEMAKLVGVEYSIIPIEPLFEHFKIALSNEFEGKAEDTTEENLQARIRGMILMGISNKFGSMVVTTGNKSEMAVGYSTLYGDMAGGFSLLKDVPKTLVYQLSHYRNSLDIVIPERIITRAPSAELRADQTDQDSLPPYAILDAIMQAYVEEDKSVKTIIKQGFSENDVLRVTRLIDRNEYKRRQSAVGVRITERGFGKDRRCPITCKFNFSE